MAAKVKIETIYMYMYIVFVEMILCFIILYTVRVSWVLLYMHK